MFWQGRGRRTVAEKNGDSAKMLGVMFGEGEVLVIVVLTAIIVFVVARKRKAK